MIHSFTGRLDTGSVKQLMFKNTAGGATPSRGDEGSHGRRGKERKEEGKRGRACCEQIPALLYDNSNARYTALVLVTCLLTLTIMLLQSRKPPASTHTGVQASVLTDGQLVVSYHGLLSCLARDQICGPMPHIGS